ncbi:haloacid dehalogenase type II [Arthrobacter tecti]
MVSAKPSVIVFDVNETLSDMSPLGKRFVDLGLPAPVAKLWFASVLRDGFALTAAGTSRSFADIAAENLRGLLAANADDNLDIESAVSQTLQAMGALDVHPDVAPGIERLASDRYRLVTLTNGSVQTSDELLTRAGVRDRFEKLLSVDDAPAWKPSASSYSFAAGECGTNPGEMLLVAVHPWDIHGAAQAGLRTAWVNRGGAAYPGHFQTPDITIASLEELSGALAGRSV